MRYERSRWRVLRTPPADGAWNMAVDEAMMEATGRDEAMSTLRLFAWNPPCLSIGYAQPISDIDEARLTAKGWGIVRRPTGGRAILHADELTYSVVGPVDEARLKGDIPTSFRRISDAILIALEQLKLRVEAVAKDESLLGTQNNPVCFETPSTYEITVGSRKLVGSAQARRRGALLQHGTLPLFGDLRRITQVLAYPNESERARAAEKVLARAATVESVLGRKVGWKEAALAFETAFSEGLNLELESGELTPGEVARAEELVEEKYWNEEWTRRI
jgi:lipoate-protein ligase A